MIWSDEESETGPFSFWLYCLCEEGSEESGPCKVGVATSPSKRLSALQGGNWRPINFVWKIRISDRRRALLAEERLLNKYRPDIYTGDRAKKLKSEWVNAKPFSALSDAVEYLSIVHSNIRRVA